MALGCGAADGEGAGAPPGGSGGSAPQSGGGAPGATGGTVVGGGPASIGGAQASGGSGTAPAGPGGAPASTGGAGGRPAGGTNPYPADVTFDWPEAVPGDGTRCTPGTYAGGFTCSFVQGMGCDQNNGAGIAFFGPITVTLSESASGEFLEVTDGTLSGDTAGFIFSSPIEGRVDCGTKRFTGSVAGDYNGFFGAIVGQFGGPMESGYDGAASKLEGGTWCMTMTNPGTPKGDPCTAIPAGQPGSCLVGSCKGAWDATLRP